MGSPVLFLQALEKGLSSLKFYCFHKEESRW